MNQLRMDFIRECADLMESYSVCLSEAARRGNHESARIYFECIRTVGRDLAKTLAEIEASEKQQDKAA